MNNKDNITYLLKFTSFNLNTIYNIMNRQIYFQDPNNFNDPLDIEFTLRNVNSISKINMENKKDIGITCFSAIKDINKIIYDVDEESNAEEGVKKINEIEELFNRLLWSHYADMHKGICLIYKKNNVENKIYKSGLIKYVNELVYNEDILNEIIYKDDILNNLYLYKHKQWEYENEYRIIVENKNSLVDEKNVNLDLEAIVLRLRAYTNNNLPHLLEIITTNYQNYEENKEINFDTNYNAISNKEIPIICINTDDPKNFNINNNFDLLKLNLIKYEGSKK